MEPIPIACDLTCLGEEERRRRAELAERMSSAIASIRELPDGFTFVLNGDLGGALEELVALEERCCPFLRFELSTSVEKVELEITGAGAKPFLRAEFPGLGR